MSNRTIRALRNLSAPKVCCYHQHFLMLMSNGLRLSAAAHVKRSVSAFGNFDDYLCRKRYMLNLIPVTQ
jgi:hypothetical protein